MPRKRRKAEEPEKPSLEDESLVKYLRSEIRRVKQQRDEFHRRSMELLGDVEKINDELKSARKQRDTWERLFKNHATKGAIAMSTTPNITPGEREWIAFASEKLWACGCRELQTDPPFLILWCGQPNCLRLFEAQVAYTPLQVAWQRAHGVADPTIVGEFRLMRSPLPQVVPPPGDLLASAGPTGQTAADASQGQIQGDNRSGLPDEPGSQQARKGRKHQEPPKE